MGNSPVLVEDRSLAEDRRSLVGGDRRRVVGGIGLPFLLCCGWLD